MIYRCLLLLFAACLSTDQKIRYPPTPAAGVTDTILIYVKANQYLVYSRPFRIVYFRDDNLPSLSTNNRCCF